MQLREIGQSGIKVAPLCLGGNVFGWTIDQETSFTVLDGFTDKGFTFIDTADIYSRWKPGNEGGESETIIGNWMKARNNRSQLIIATKVGMDLGGDKKGLSAKYIVQAVEASLKRLQTDYIDLYQSHKDDPDTPLDETAKAFDQLVQQGKVRALGASNYTGERFTAALQVSAQHHLASYQCMQPHYNLYERAGYETDLEQICLSHHIAVIPYFSLASGFLTGKYRTADDFGKSPRGGNMGKFLNERGLRILAALDAVAAEQHANPAQVALAWLMARPSITAPIVSATNLAQLADLVKATTLALTTAQIAALNAASSY